MNIDKILKELTLEEKLHCAQALTSGTLRK